MNEPGSGTAEGVWKGHGLVVVYSFYFLWIDEIHPWISDRVRNDALLYQLVTPAEAGV